MPFSPALMKANAMRLILASSSPRRQQLLTELGLAFDIIKPRIDESRRADEPAIDYARRLSREKADAVAAPLADETGLILSADTIVLLSADAVADDAKAELLGKPRDAADARRMLIQLRERPHQVITAFTLLRKDRKNYDPRVITRHETTTVHMRAYSDEEIERYISSGDPFDKAGAYAIQNEAFHPVARIEGSYSNVVGLPITAVRAALRDMGYPLP